ncbi:MAG: long-chain fatty acid--CoA ligase [Patescibacteria group bacterium]
MEQTTIVEEFFKVAEKYPKKKALSYKKDRVYFSLSYKKLAQTVKIFAAGLQDYGFSAKDNLAIICKNSPEWAIFDLSAMAIGAVTVPLHNTLSPKIIAYVLNHSRAKTVVVGGNYFLNKILLVQDDLKYLESIIFVGELEKDLQDMCKKKLFFWSDVIKKGADKELKSASTLGDDVCSIIYTSGTTGLPKGVCLTHRNFLSDIEAITKAVPTRTSDIFLSFLPLSHVLERTAGYYVPLLTGCQIVYAQSVKALPWNLQEVKPTVLICVPRVLEKFHENIYEKIKAGSKWKRALFFYALKQDIGSWRHQLLDEIIFKKIRKKLGGHLRLLISGGASLNPSLAKFFKKIGLLILEGYGLTETAPVVAVNSPDNYKFGTVGRPLDGVELAVDREREILIRGAMVMLGYYLDKKQTAAAIDQEGWFHTGDIGFIDPEKFVTIIGRKKEMMVTSGGKNIWPEPLEQELNADKYISQSAVIAHKRKFVSALIIPAWNEINNYLSERGLKLKEPIELVDSPEIAGLLSQRLSTINDNLPEHEQIKKFCLLPNEFSEVRDELTPTLKLRRHIIDENYRREIEAMYR